MRNKKIKYGKINIGPGEFKDENALVRISIMIPMKTYKDLKKLSLTDGYRGKYQVMIRDILGNFVEKSHKAKKKSID